MNVTAVNLPATVSAALLVIAGEFGNGTDRQKKLSKAGYDYQKVQKCVNDLLPILNKYA